GNVMRMIGANFQNIVRDVILSNRECDVTTFAALKRHALPFVDTFTAFNDHVCAHASALPIRAMRLSRSRCRRAISSTRASDIAGRLRRMDRWISPPHAARSVVSG